MDLHSNSQEAAAAVTAKLFCVLILYTFSVNFLILVAFTGAVTNYLCKKEILARCQL